MKKIIVKGVVTSGLGKGGYYVSKEPYYSFFSRIFKEKPFPGTLNVILNDADGVSLKLSKLFRPRAGGAIRFSYGFVKRGEKIFPCVIVRPELSRHPPNVIELVSPVYLRKALNLRDGDLVEIIIIED